MTKPITGAELIAILEQCDDAPYLEDEGDGGSIVIDGYFDSEKLLRLLNARMQES